MRNSLSAIRLLNLLLLLAGVTLIPGCLVRSYLPADYAQYREGFTIGLWISRILLLAGGCVGLMLARRLAEVLEPYALTPDLPADTRLTSAEWGFLIGITLLAAGLRLPGLNGSLTFDEVRLVKSLIIQNPIRVFLFPPGSAHALHSLLANGTVRLFGLNAWSVRLPAMLAGALAPALLYSFVRQIFNRRTAMLAALLLCLTPIHVWFSQEAKGNSLLASLVIVSWILMTRLAVAWRPWTAVGYLASLIGIAASHLSGIMFVIVQPLVFCLPTRWRVFAKAGVTFRRRILVLQAAALWGIMLFYSPIMMFLVRRGQTGHLTEGSPQFFSLLGEVFRQFTVLNLTWPTALPMILAGAVGIVILAVRRPGELMLLILPFGLGLWATILLKLFSFPRYHIYFLPAMACLAAVGLNAMLFRPQGSSTGRDWGQVLCRLSGILVVVCTATSYAWTLVDYYRLPKSNYRAVAEYLARPSAPAPAWVIGFDQHGYPAHGLVFYTDRFETDSTIRQRIAGMTGDQSLAVVVFDPLALHIACPLLEERLLREGVREHHFYCLGELDQYRVRDSYVFRLTVEQVRQYLEDATRRG